MRLPAPVCHVANEFLSCLDCGRLYLKADGPVHPFCREGKNGFFYRNLDDFDDALRPLGAVVTIGDFTGLDETKVPPDLMDAYRGLIRYGYANGLMPGGTS
jgi:hypothetical protein